MMLDAGTNVMDEAAELREKIAKAETELKALKARLEEVESAVKDEHVPAQASSWPLLPVEYERYGRQIVLPGLGIKGQLRLRAAKVLVVGAGGLGCPAAAYIAGAGVGTIGLVDGDVVETSNLHRQILHSTATVGMPKVESAVSFLKELNPNVAYHAHNTHLTPSNAESIVSQYDLVLDCTDHPTSRYLISDACVLLGKPLVSASALRTDGQLIVLNNPPAPQGSTSGGPCYRCLFPRPPPADSLVSCGEGGVLGPVVGAMGVLQALEAIKLVASGVLDLDAEAAPAEATRPQLLIFSAGEATRFQSVRMRGRSKNCFACGESSTLTLESLRGSVDYVQFCGLPTPVEVLEPEERVSVAQYKEISAEGRGDGGSGTDGGGHLLLDVRSREHFEVGSIPGAVNIPFQTFMGKYGRASPTEDWIAQAPWEWMPPNLPPSAPIYVMCRVGNDSQVVARRLKDMGLDRGGERFIGDVKGGMKAWRDEVDDTMPFL